MAYYKLVRKRFRAMGKIVLEFTDKQLKSMLNIIDTIEAMYGCSAGPEEEGDWDTEMKKEIKNIDKMLKNNGYKRG